MKTLKILIVEGNIEEDSKIFIKAAGKKVSENLKELFLNFEPSTKVEIIHPGNLEENSRALDKIKTYDGIAFTGGAMRLNDMSDEIKKHISFAKNCLENGKKILAICWGLQVCSFAVGGKVNKGKKGGLSGKPLYDNSNIILKKMYELTNGQIPLIGVGGISSGKDCYEKIKSGASLVQLYTALVYSGPNLINNIKGDLIDLIKTDGYKNVSEVIGKSV